MGRGREQRTGRVGRARHGNLQERRARADGLMYGGSAAVITIALMKLLGLH